MIPPSYTSQFVLDLRFNQYAALHLKYALLAACVRQGAMLPSVRLIYLVERAGVDSTRPWRRL